MNCCTCVCWINCCICAVLKEPKGLCSRFCMCWRPGGRMANWCAGLILPVSLSLGQEYTFRPRTFHPFYQTTQFKILYRCLFLRPKNNKTVAFFTNSPAEHIFSEFRAIFRRATLPVVFVLVSAISVFHKAAKPILESIEKIKNTWRHCANNTYSLCTVYLYKNSKYVFLYFSYFLLLSKKEYLNATSSRQQRIKN
jgi:hypothetical protein